MAHDFENMDDLDDLSDGELRRLVRDRLREHRGIDPADITVDVHDRVVELSGRVGTEGERRVAERVVTDVIGLPLVRNDLVVDSLRRAARGRRRHRHFPPVRGRPDQRAVRTPLRRRPAVRRPPPQPGARVGDSHTLRLLRPARHRRAGRRAPRGRHRRRATGGRAHLVPPPPLRERRGDDRRRRCGRHPPGAGCRAHRAAAGARRAHRVVDARAHRRGPAGLERPPRPRPASPRTPEPRVRHRL